MRLPGPAWIAACLVLASTVSLAGTAGASPAGVSSAEGFGTANRLPTARPTGAYISVTTDVSARSTATINEHLIGVDGPGPVAAEGEMRAIGVHWVRTDTSFEGTLDGQPVYDCATGAWNPSLLDSRIAGIRAEGAVPLVIVDYSPPCLTQDPSSPTAQRAPPDVGANQARWDALVEEMGAHEIGDEGVRYFEVWNEPDGTFFSGGLDAYLQLYSDTVRSLEVAASRQDTRIYVGGPALADVLDTQDMDWVDGLLNYVLQHDLPLDFISWHTYVNDPYAGPMNLGGFAFCWGRPNGPGANLCYYKPNLDEATIAAEVAQTRQALSGFPALHPLLIVDEWNLDAEGDPRMDQPYDAAYAAAVLDSSQADGLSGMSFFDVNNSETDPDQNWGLLYSDLKPKPVYETFLYWHEMAAWQVPVSTRSMPGEHQPALANLDANGRVGAVAARSRDGRATVLLYDFKPYDPSGDYGTTDPTPYDRTVRLVLRGLSGSYRYTRDATDGRHPSGAVLARGIIIPAGGSASLTFTLPGEGVELVTLVRGR